MFNDNFLIFAIFAFAAIIITSFPLFDTAQKTRQMTVCLERNDHQWTESNTCIPIENKEHKND